MNASHIRLGTSRPQNPLHAPPARTALSRQTITLREIPLLWGLAVPIRRRRLRRLLVLRPAGLMSILRSILCIGCSTEIAYTLFIQNNILYE